MKSGDGMQIYCSAIIPAAGNSTRMGIGTSKQFLKLLEKPAISYTLSALEQADQVYEIVLVCREEDQRRFENCVKIAGVTKPVRFARGGCTRQQSVWTGIQLASESATHFVIHDGARPLITPELIEKVIEDAMVYQAAALAVRMKDTIKIADSNEFAIETPDRSLLWAVQTPQVFEKTSYLYAIKQAVLLNKDYTDDCQLMEQIGIPVHLCESDYDNIKLTTFDDVFIAESILQKRRQKHRRDTVRIGHGYDVHKLVQGRKLVLGGVTIPHETGLLGHSDADVLTHAVADALLGAAALGDIGSLFPDHDLQYKDADSIVLLKEVCKQLKQNGFSVENIDATILAQAPKLKPYIDKMRHNLAKVCEIDINRLSVKATTEERLGFTGRKEGIAAHAVCLIK